MIAEYLPNLVYDQAVASPDGSDANPLYLHWQDSGSVSLLRNDDEHATVTCELAWLTSMKCDTA